MTPDGELLRQFVEARDEAAFAALVQRHLNLVYSAALRQVHGNTALAGDVTQAVFTELARKAAALRPHPLLTGWLYTTTHFSAANAVRRERRRQAREQEAHAMNQLWGNNSDPDWQKLRPLLDEVMHELKADDRAAILLRYFEQCSYAEVGAPFALNENSARMRVERAVEKLRLLLAKRGVTSTAETLAATLATQTLAIAPAGLAAGITQAALAGAKGGGTLVFFKLMSLKLKIGIVSALVAAGLTTTLLIQHHQRVPAANYIIARAPWADMGAATPKAAIHTLLWALTADKIERAAELVQWEVEGKSSALEQQMVLATTLKPWVTEFASIRIISLTQKTPDEASVQLEEIYKQPGRKNPVAVKLRRTGDRWQAVAKIQHVTDTGYATWLPFCVSME